METLDCRGMAVPRTVGALLRFYDAAQPGVRFEALIDRLDNGIRMILIEAGAKHSVEPAAAGHVRLEIERARSCALMTAPGVHHVVARGTEVWTSDRCHRAARLDGVSGEIIASCDVTVEASHLDVDAKGERMFIADRKADKMIAMDARDMTVIDEWDAPGAPQLPMVTEDGTVCVTGPWAGTITIARPGKSGGHYDVGTYEVGVAPHDPVVTPDGRFVFVGCSGDGIVAKVRLSDGSVLGRTPVGDGPTHLALHGERVYAANSYDGRIICLSVDGDVLASAYSGRWAHVPQVTPDGKLVYVSNFFDDTVAVFDAETLEQKAVLEAEAYPHGLDVSPDGRFVIATGFSSDFIRVYDANRHVELARIEVGQGSSHSAFVANGGTAYVGCSVANTLARIDTGLLSCTDRISISG